MNRIPTLSSVDWSSMFPFVPYSLQDWQYTLLVFICTPTEFSSTSWKTNYLLRLSDVDDLKRAVQSCPCFLYCLRNRWEISSLKRFTPAHTLSNLLLRPRKLLRTIWPYIYINTQLAEHEDDQTRFIHGYKINDQLRRRIEVSKPYSSSTAT